MLVSDFVTKKTTIQEFLLDGSTKGTTRLNLHIGPFSCCLEPLFQKARHDPLLFTSKWVFHHTPMKRNRICVYVLGFASIRRPIGQHGIVHFSKDFLHRASRITYLLLAVKRFKGVSLNTHQQVHFSQSHENPH